MPVLTSRMVAQDLNAVLEIKPDYLQVASLPSDPCAVLYAVLTAYICARRSINAPRSMNPSFSPSSAAAAAAAASAANAQQACPNHPAAHSRQMNSIPSLLLPLRPSFLPPISPSTPDRRWPDAPPSSTALEGKFAVAREDLEKVLKIKGTDQVAIVLRICDAMSGTDVSATLDQLTLVVHALAAKKLIEQKNWHGARDHLNRAIDVAADSVDLLLSRAECHKNLGDRENVLADT
eukprot:2085160-Rhodomonas_salina.2